MLLTSIGDEDGVGGAMAQTVANSKGSTRSAANAAASSTAAAYSADLKSQPPPVVRQ